MDSSRIKQVNALIQSKLSPIIQEYSGDEIITITRVDTTSDLAHTKIHLGVLKDDERIIEYLNSKSKEIRSDLARSIKLRATPMIHFVIDLNESYAEKIDDLFKKI